MNLKPLPTLFLLVSQSVCSLGLMLLTNHTIDDTDPSIRYHLYDPNASPVRCSLKGCFPVSASTSNNDYSQMINGTTTSMAGKITITFTGTTVAVYFATMHTYVCAIHIDGDYVASFQPEATEATQPGVGSVLGYSNTSIPDGSHYIVLISVKGAVVDFDALVYTTYAIHPLNTVQFAEIISSTISSSSAPLSSSAANQPSSALPAPPSQSPPTQPPIPSPSPSTFSSTASSSGSQSLHSSASTTSWSSKISSAGQIYTGTPTALTATGRRPPPPAIIAGVIAGCTSLFAAVCATFIFLRRRARRWKSRSVHQPFSLGETQPRVQPTSSTASVSLATPIQSSLADHLLKLEARFDALASTVRRPNNTETDARPPAYDDAA
ncbi:hypothetical protein FB451DRAFT_1183137 [Mycena latifolia]|nr:hypothetical protein FB451DRAFT_1183137 [Mycena latifolia]